MKKLEDYCFSYVLGGYYPEYGYTLHLEDYSDDELYGSAGYNVEWCDREGRHPWVDITLSLNSKGNYKVTVHVGSKDGRIDEKGEDLGMIENLFEKDPSEVEEILCEIMDDLRYEVENDC